MDPNSSPANMSESLRMTLEVVRDEQIFNERSKSLKLQGIQSLPHSLITVSQSFTQFDQSLSHKIKVVHSVVQSVR